MYDKVFTTGWLLYGKDTLTKLLVLLVYRASLVAQMVKNLLEMQETQVRSLGWEDPLEKGMATQSSILSWRIPWTEEPGGLLSMGSPRVRQDWAIKHIICTCACHFSCVLLFLTL